jgi:hypothetical protein
MRLRAAVASSGVREPGDREIASSEALNRSKRASR